MGSRQAPARRLDLKKGDEVTLEFEGLGSAGYRWRERVDGDPDVVSISWRVGPVDAKSSRSAGSSASEIAVVRAQQVGEVSIYFLQLRPWERDVEPLRCEEVVVRVRTNPSCVS